MTMTARNISITRDRAHRRIGAARIAALAALMTILSGCASMSPSKPPPPPAPPSLGPDFTIKAEARPAVGAVIPIEIVPPRDTAAGNVKVVSVRFAAIDENGSVTPALSPEEAAARAGDAQKLRAALTDEGSAALVAKEVGLAPAVATGFGLVVGAEGGPFGLVLGVFAWPVITGYGFVNGARLAVSPQQRLEAISYTDANYTYLSTMVLRDKVFIYFPEHQYRRLETILHLRNDVTTLEADQTLTQDWPAEEPLKSIAQK